MQGKTTHARSDAPGAVKKVVIAGGGTAGWMTAAALSTYFADLVEITLVESEEIGTIGVGESTVPPLQKFHRVLGISEREFMTECAATFKLGIWFENWGHLGEKYLHPFGVYGQPSLTCDFHNFWLRGREIGLDEPLGAYNHEWSAGMQGKFALHENPRINYAYHFDAALYARFLRRICERRGVRRVEGKIRHVRLAANGDVQALELADDRVVEGDFFVDCTGFRGLLIEQALHTGYEDWSNYLPCDSAVAFQTRVDTPPAPYTACYAHTAGWRWNIPVQHRVGNGVVYCSRYMSDDEARHLLVTESGGTPVKEPWQIRTRAGRRKKAWNRNVIAIGLSSGFVEPLESTSIHMIMSAASRLLHFFPFSGMKAPVVEHYNRLARAEIEHIRDFVCMHYYLTTRDDSPFWRYCRAMEIPESLRRRIDLFRKEAYVYVEDGDLFAIDSWIAVMMGQGIEPESYHHFPRTNDGELTRYLAQMRERVAKVVAPLPAHADFVRKYCGASEAAWG
ncbi:MAG TPA: tryptophan halogenase family protein [Steroidobacteraceae bacterium]|nr:tryptophan halogenase family protein [Steroidobacteraceae bacterium]